MKVGKSNHKPLA